MAGQKSKSARTIAIEVLNRCDPKHNYATPILNKLLGETDQKQRTTDLVLGTIRNRYAIDTVIAEFSGRSVDRIPAKLLNIIRIGTYELVYSPDTAQYSIVNEAVENTKALMGKKQVGFVNAVLRKITRGITNRQIELSRSNPRCTLCQNTKTGCQFNANFLPDLESSPVDYLSIVFSLPKWLVSDWFDEFGMELAQRICFASNRKPGIYLKPNGLKTTTKNLTEKFKQVCIEYEIIDNNPESNTDSYESSMIKIKSPSSITELPGFSEGLFTVQDITASRVVRMLRPQSYWTILDLCAAPGVKATQLAEFTGDSAKIVATDIDSERLKKVKENITRLDIKSVEVVPYDRIPTSKFDCVLLDVPCSNTGVLARRVETRYRITQNVVKKLTKTQQGLLNTAASMLKPNGIICYSTCSIQKEENNNLIRDFLEENPNFTLYFEKLTLQTAQQFDCDGGYMAILALK